MAALCSCSTFVALLAVLCGIVYYYPTYPDSKFKYRPLPIVAFNKLGAAVEEHLHYKLPGTDLDPEAIVDAVKRSSGLSDLNDTASFWDGYKSLVDSINAESNLNTLGRVIIRQVLESTLKQRLDIIEYRKKHQQEVEKVRVKAPVFILGLPR